MKNKILFAGVLSSALWACTSTTPLTTSSAAPALTQTALNQMADTLKVSYRHLDNRPDDKCDAERANGSCFQVEISLTASHDFAPKNWQIYLSHIAPLQSSDNGELQMKHINGDLHQIWPSKTFSGFKAGQTKTIKFRADGWSVSSTDALPNYYIVADGLKPRLIASTKPLIDPATKLETRPFVKPYLIADQEKNFKRLKDETTVWATNQQLFSVNKGSYEHAQAINNAIIPSPKSIKLGKADATLDLVGGYMVELDNVADQDVHVALERLKEFGIKPYSEDVNEQGVPMRLSVVKDSSKKANSYQLSIKQSGIEIIGVDAAGVANGLQSLASLVTLNKTKVSLMEVSDEPRYEFRGLHIDVARNFHSKALILKLLDQMAAYKLNKLHLHLADDEGWRLAIDGLEELTSVGSKRCFDPSEDRCLLTQLGSGPSEDTPVNGFYSKAEYQEILRAATARHIQVIPSLDMPGHSRAAVKSMEARYRKLMKQGDQKAAEQYLLSDPDDKTVYQSIQFYSDNTINVCMPSSYAFVEKVIDEVKTMHAEAGHPLTRYHIGADETAGAWVESPKCKAFIASNNQGITEVKQLGGYFIEKVASILTKRGIETAAWGDGLMHTNVENMPSVVQANAWTPLFANGHRQAHEMTNRDWQVVVSSPEVTYFDFPYEADPEEHGYYWASRQTNSRKVFEFMPDNLPVHAETRNNNINNPLTLDDTTVESKGAPMAKGKTFHGLQGHLWSENVRTDEQAQYMLFPRLIALAERAWHKPQWEPAYNYQGAVYGKDSKVFSEKMREARNKQWNIFANVIARKEMPKLDKQGVFYRIPTVGAKLDSYLLRANVIFPGMSIEYQVNQERWQKYSGPVSVKGEVKVRAVSADGKRKGRSLTVF